ncbi:MAG: hypothetical protein ACI4V5_08250 [Prevotella sp.]
MVKSLIEELPRTISEGRREAQHILERHGSGTQIRIQSDKHVLSDKALNELFRICLCCTYFFYK